MGPSAGLNAVEKRGKNSTLVRKGIAMDPLEDRSQIILCARSLAITGRRRKQTD
jgi:hypothetical protein